MKINVGLIGRGKWGRIIKKKLTLLSNLKFVIGKNFNFVNEIKKKEVKWVFVATPNKTHFKIVKKCLQAGVNVFCEKPLSESVSETKYLINLAKRKKVKLFISDLYDFYSNKMKQNKKNIFVYRSKLVKKSDNEFFYRFMYHDISILYKTLKKYKSFKSFLEKNNKNKIFFIKIEFKNKQMVKFSYNLKSTKKIHFINGSKISSRKDVLRDMINKVLKNDIDFKKNNNKALFIINFLNKIQKKLNYVY